MNKIRIGIIGYGAMGKFHADYLFKDEIKGGELTAVCDLKQERLLLAESLYGEKVRQYNDPEALFEANVVDAVMIATPHYSHPALSIKAFEHGLHVLVEKPAGVYTKQVHEMNDAAKKSGKIFSIMFCLRTDSTYLKLRELIKSGELGEIRRINWIKTNWYRPQSYYNAGNWRATWEGEGGGVLLNQCPHNLDILQWITGMPKRIRAFCSFGKYHQIEVEDDVTAYMEYQNGATGVFITSTADTPGTNRLELTGNNGKIVCEDGHLLFWRLRTPERTYNSTYQGFMGEPEAWKIELPIAETTNMHQAITRNFVNSIMNGEELVARGEDGIFSLQLSNAMLLSTWLDDWVEIPINDDLYFAHLEKKVKKALQVKNWRVV